MEILAEDLRNLIAIGSAAVLDGTWKVKLCERDYAILKHIPSNTFWRTENGYEDLEGWAMVSDTCTHCNQFIPTMIDLFQVEQCWVFIKGTVS